MRRSLQNLKTKIFIFNILKESDVRYVERGRERERERERALDGSMRSGRERPGLLNHILTIDDYWNEEGRETEATCEGTKKFSRSSCRTGQATNCSEYLITLQIPSLPVLPLKILVIIFLGSRLILETRQRQEDGIILNKLEHFDIP